MISSWMEDLVDWMGDRKEGDREMKRVIGIRTKTKYVMKPKEYRDYTTYWQRRLIDNPPTHFYKHNQHGLRSPLFKIIYLDIVDSPKTFLEEGVLHTKKAIRIVGEEINEKPMTKKLLTISDYDEWFGPIYTCPFCAIENIMDDFLFCPMCGGNLEGFRFEKGVC